jgi:simple sugar transport system permease protein
MRVTASSNVILRVLLALAPLIIALVVASLMLVLAGAPPGATYLKLITGSFGTPVKISDVLVVWVSLAVCSAGLLVTFTAGQWNIGVEGQIMMGAVFATGVAQALWEQPGLVVIPLMALAGIAGGTLWGVVVGLLKIFGRVNEIFGGLGLNFIVRGLSIYLIAGPWKQIGTSSIANTEQFPQALWLPTLPGLRVSVYAAVAALIVVVVVYLSLRGTVWGLQLKAVGRNIRSAHVMGLSTRWLMISAYAACGACAGLVGAYLTFGWKHQLIPDISSGYGFLGILIVLLSGMRGLLVAPIALFFAAVSVGSTALQLDLQLDSSLGGVLQASIVLLFILTQGFREKYLAKEG